MDLNHVEIKHQNNLPELSPNVLMRLKTRLCLVKGESKKKKAKERNK